MVSVDRSKVKSATLVAIVAAGWLSVTSYAVAQAPSISSATDFRFDSAFVVDPPDSTHWEPPPGGLLEDGRYVAQTSDHAHEIFLTLGTEYSSALLESPQWQNEAFIRSYHEQLLEAQLSELTERNIDRSVSVSFARLDARFPLPAIERRVLLDDTSSSSGAVTRTIAEYTWRFPHPDYAILEFVVSISTVIDPGAPLPEITVEQLEFLDSLEALHLDTAPDIAIQVPGNNLDAIARGHDSLWVTDNDANTLIRIDQTSRQVASIVPVGRGPHAFAVTNDAVWIANHNDDTVMRIDPVTSTVTASAQVPVGPHQLLENGSELWLVADASCLITRIDPATAQLVGDTLSFGSVRRSLSGRRERLWGILGQRAGRCTDMSITMAVANMGDLYVFERFKGTLTHIDNSSRSATVATGVEIGGFVIVDDELWGVDDLDSNGKIYHVDSTRGDVLAAIDGGQVSGTPVFAGGLIWVTRERDNTIIRIDPAANVILGSALPMNRPSAMVADDSGIWVSGSKSVVHFPFE